MTRATIIFGFLACLPVTGTTVFGPDPDTYEAPGGTITGGISLDGVVRINSGVGCSGALLADGWHVLTAAHCVDAGVVPGGVTVYFETLGASYERGVSQIMLAPGWSGLAGQELDGIDIAILRLASAATGVTGYSLYTGSAEIGSTITIAGYGQSGVGAADPGNYPFGTRRYGQNIYDADGTISLFGGSSGVLVGDFDDGTALHDAMGTLYPSLADLGLAEDEVSLAPGDSGGPSFLNGYLVGIHSFGARISGPGAPDVNGTLNFSFGELFGDTSVSANASWIEAQLTPEPGSFALLGFGLVGLAWRANRLRARR